MDRIKETTKNVLCTCIKGYRYFISPLMAPRCRFYPSCSTYALTALEIHGLKGIVLTIKRVLRCHPLHKGGYDPVPQEVKK